MSTCQLLVGFVMFLLLLFIIVICETLRMAGISCYIVNLLWKLEIGNLSCWKVAKYWFFIKKKKLKIATIKENRLSG
jgi:hypothetical protein